MNTPNGLIVKRYFLCQSQLKLAEWVFMGENYLVQTSNYARKTTDVIMLNLKKLLSYIVNNTETFMKLTVCSCHVTYAFQSESTLYSCLNGKELLARSRREI